MADLRHPPPSSPPFASPLEMSLRSSATCPSSHLLSAPRRPHHQISLSLKMDGTVAPELSPSSPSSIITSLSHRRSANPAACPRPRPSPFHLSISLHQSRAPTTTTPFHLSPCTVPYSGRRPRALPSVTTMTTTWIRIASPLDRNRTSLM